MVETVVYQSRTCPSSQESIDETYNRTSPWEYDNPERNKADGCMSRGLLSGAADIQGNLDLLWHEGGQDCDLPNYKVWRDSTIIGESGSKKSIPDNTRESQVLPEGKVFVFGSSSHPCTTGVGGTGCNATDGDWRKTQPWDKNAGCSWLHWASGNYSNCEADAENGLSEGICPEGYEWSGSSDDDSWWSRGDIAHEHPIIRYKGTRSSPRVPQEDDLKGTFHENIRFGIVPHNSFAEEDAKIYWNLGEAGDQIQPQTGQPGSNYPGRGEIPRMLDIRENCGNPDCSIMIGGNHAIRYSDGGLNHVNSVISPASEQSGAHSDGPEYTLEKCIAKKPWIDADNQFCGDIVLSYKGDELATDANIQGDRLLCEREGRCDYIPREEIPYGFTYNDIDADPSFPTRTAGSESVRDQQWYLHNSQQIKLGGAKNIWWPSDRIEDYNTGDESFLGLEGGGSGINDRWNHGRYSYCTTGDHIKKWDLPCCQVTSVFGTHSPLDITPIPGTYKSGGDPSGEEGTQCCDCTDRVNCASSPTGPYTANTPQTASREEREHHELMCNNRIEEVWRGVGIGHEFGVEQRARCLNQVPRNLEADFWGNVDPGDQACKYIGGPRDPEWAETGWIAPDFTSAMGSTVDGTGIVDYGYDSRSYNPFGNNLTGPVIGLHTTEYSSCDSDTFTKNNRGMSMGEGTKRSNPYWNVDWGGWIEDGSRFSIFTSTEGAGDIWDVSGDFAGPCLEDWSSPTQNTTSYDKDGSVPVPERNCPGWWDTIAAVHGGDPGHDPTDDDGTREIECQEQHAVADHNSCAAALYRAPTDDDDGCYTSERDWFTGRYPDDSWLSGAVDTVGDAFDDFGGSYKSYACSEWSKGGCGENYVNQYKHMISEDKDESFGSWGLYDQSHHIRQKNSHENETYSWDGEPEKNDYERGGLSLTGLFGLGDEGVENQNMASSGDKITPKCFKTKDNYFKTDPINGVPLDSKFGYGENSPRKYVYRDWNPLLIVLELAQDLSRYDTSEIEFDFDIELKGKGWGINRDGLTVAEDTTAYQEDSGAVINERRDFCQIHKTIDEGDFSDNVFDSQIYDHRSTWRWGTKKSDSLQHPMREYLECSVDYYRDLSDGAWGDNVGYNEYERSLMAHDTCSPDYLADIDADEMILDLPYTVLKEPDKTLKLRDCQEAGCVANGSTLDMNGCSYSKVLSYSGLHQFQDNSMDNTTRLLHDFSNLPIRDENDNLLYVRRQRTVFNSGSYEPLEGSETTTEYKAIPLYLNEDMLEELMVKYHKLLCCYGKLDWKLFSTLFCGFSPIFDRIIKSDGTDGKKTLDEQKCSSGDSDCDGSSHDRSSTEELVTGGFYFDVSELDRGGRVQPTSSSLPSATTGNVDAEFMSDGDCEFIQESTSCKRVGQSFITEPGLPLSGNKKTIKNGIEEGYYGVKDDSIPGRTRFPGLKLFSERQAKYIKMAFDYLEGNYSGEGDDHLMGSYIINPPWQEGQEQHSEIESNLSKYYTDNFSHIDHEKVQPRGGANIYPGGVEISEGNTWHRKREYTHEDLVNGGVTFLEFLSDQHWFKNWDNIAKKQYCHEDYFKCDAIVYEEYETVEWDINSSKRGATGRTGPRYGEDHRNAQPSFSEISEKCLSFINNDICPIPHRSSDGGGNKYCERLPISEQHAMGGGPEGSSRLAPPGIKMPEEWKTKTINDPYGDGENLSDLINTGNALTDVILSNKEGYGKYCINPIDPQYYRSNLCLDFCGNAGGEGGDASVITEDDQCINMIDNYCEDVFMGLKRGKTEYQLKYDYNSPCTSNDDCNPDISGVTLSPGHEEDRYCYTEIDGGKCGPLGTSSNDWKWVNSEPMLLEGEEANDALECTSHADCSSYAENPFCYYDIGRCGPSETYNSRIRNRRSDDEIDFFEMLGLKQDDYSNGKYRTTGRGNQEEAEHLAVFKDGTYYNEEMNELFKWLYPPYTGETWGFKQDQRIMVDENGDWIDQVDTSLTDTDTVRLEEYGCNSEAFSKGWCGKDYETRISPMKNKHKNDPAMDTPANYLQFQNDLHNVVPGRGNIIKDICIGHFPGYDITDKQDDKHWLYRFSEGDDESDSRDLFESGLTQDLTMDKILTRDRISGNQGDLNPNFNPKLGEDENFYRWIVNKGPGLERVRQSATSGNAVEVIQGVDEEDTTTISYSDEKDRGGVIPDMYHRMKHHWKYLTGSDMDYSMNVNSDLLEALSYDRDYARYLLHRYNTAKYNTYEQGGVEENFTPDFGPHHLYNYIGVNYDDFNYSNMSLIDVKKTEDTTGTTRYQASNVDACNKLCSDMNEAVAEGSDGEEALECLSAIYNNGECEIEQEIRNVNDIPVGSNSKKDPFRIHRPGDKKDEAAGLLVDWNSLNRGVNGAILPCIEEGSDRDLQAQLYQCAQHQSLESDGSINLSGRATISQNMDCSIFSDSIRACDIQACTQLQAMSAIDGINVRDEAEIIQNMECNIGGTMIAPVFCPVDFDCSESPNDLVENPSTKTCSSSICTIDDCCPGLQGSTSTLLNSTSTDTGLEELIKENKVSIVLIILIIIILFISFSSFILI